MREARPAPDAGKRASETGGDWCVQRLVDLCARESKRNGSQARRGRWPPSETSREGSASVAGGYTGALLVVHARLMVVVVGSRGIDLRLPRRMQPPEKSDVLGSDLRATLSPPKMTMMTMVTIVTIILLEM